MKRVQQGFTLIELMIVVAIVGILAAIALPAYRDFTIRSKMSEVAAALGACKTSVTEYINTKNAWPANLDQSGCSSQVTQYLATMAIANGTITGTSQNTGATPAECQLTLTADVALNPSTWTGSVAGCDRRFVPATFR
jgi:type IV pilus assembly protein PilA